MKPSPSASTPPIPTPSGPVRITISNNSPRVSVRGQLTAVVARGWSVSPSTLRYNLAPNTFAVLDVTVSRENLELMNWGMLAQIEHGDTTLYDVPTKFDYPVKINSDQLKNEYMVIIRNRGGLPLIGTAELFTDFDTAGEDTPITPISASFHIQPYQDKRIVYRNNGPIPPSWMFAKVSANNQTFYHEFDLKTEE
jgi:hypothetical protein